MAATKESIQVSQFIPEKRQRVFDAFMNPDLARRWLPAGCSMISNRAEPRVGGKYREEMSCEGETYIGHGVYREIIANKKIVFTHHWEVDQPVETLVTVHFGDKDEGTEIILVQEGFKSAESAKDHEEGWASALANFAAIFAKEAVL